MIYLPLIKGGAYVKIFFVLRHAGAHMMHTQTQLIQNRAMQYSNSCHVTKTTLQIQTSSLVFTNLPGSQSPVSTKLFCVMCHMQKINAIVGRVGICILLWMTAKNEMKSKQLLVLAPANIRQLTNTIHLQLHWLISSRFWLFDPRSLDIFEYLQQKHHHCWNRCYDSWIMT